MKCVDADRLIKAIEDRQSNGEDTLPLTEGDFIRMLKDADEMPCELCLKGKEKR